MMDLVRYPESSRRRPASSYCHRGPLLLESESFLDLHWQTMRNFGYRPGSPVLLSLVVPPRDLVVVAAG